MTALPPLPKKSMSQLACRLSGQLCLALGFMSWGWAAGHPSKEGEQGTAPFRAVKGAGRPLLDPPNHLFGEERLYFALSVLL